MTYDPTIPLATDLLSDSQSDIQINFTMANNLFGVNHVNFNNSLPAIGLLGYLTTTADEGKHTIIHQKRINFGVATPVTAANEGALYCQEVAGGGRVESFYKYPGGAGAPIMQLSFIKAWVKFAGATGVVADSYNVAGVVRNGAGDYTITFTTALTNANYIVNITPTCGLSGTGIGAIPGLNAQAAANCRIFTKALTTNLGTDPTAVHVLIVGT